MPERTKANRTRTGKILAESDIRALSQEAEGGYERASLVVRRRGRPLLGTEAAGVVPVRLDPELREAVAERAAAEATTVSEVIRRALRRYLGAA